MKTVLKKIIIVLMVIIMLSEFSATLTIHLKVPIGNVSYAASDVMTALNTITGAVGNVLEGIVGLLTYQYRLLPIITVFLLQSIGDGIAGIANPGGILPTATFTPDSIFFNKYDIANIDFFRDLSRKNRYSC